MNPDRHAQSHYDYFEQLMKGDEASAEAHRRFYDEYNAVLDMDADYYLETIQVVFQDFSLVEGTWDVRNEAGKLERVRPADITQCALLTIEGELDDISGSGQTAAAHDLCAAIPKKSKRHLEVAGAGHFGIFAGSRWRKVVYPEVQAFILSAQGAQTVVAKEASAPKVKATVKATVKAAAKPKATVKAKATATKVAAKKAAK